MRRKWVSHSLAKMERPLRLTPSSKEAAEIWLRQLRDKVHPFLNFHAHPIKVAIVDTGVQFDKKTRIMYGPRLKEVRSWTDPQSGKEGVLCPDGEDMDGHGTHATSVFLEVDPFSEVFVAKVFESRDEKQGASMQTELQHRVANVSARSQRGMWDSRRVALDRGWIDVKQTLSHVLGDHVCRQRVESPSHHNVLWLRSTSRDNRRRD
jgi:hypothetical protein